MNKIPGLTLRVGKTAVVKSMVFSQQNSTSHKSTWYLYFATHAGVERRRFDVPRA